MAELERMNLNRDPMVANLLAASATAKRDGQPERASRLLQQAATLAPYDEAIWWALLDVVQSEADRIACLENILAINPTNLEANRLLRLVGIDQNLGDLTPPVPAGLKPEMIPPPGQVRKLPNQGRKVRTFRQRVVRFLVLALFFVLLAAALGIVLSILIYGFN
ncbi:MAG: hypothetical protein SF123_14195 [Chloroflexota bacterium]|nr:hypothetical protein [Chloroflexota bacterium]